jgi:hypothetical protein
MNPSKESHFSLFLIKFIEKDCFTTALGFLVRND